jgi:hypothetical protein
MDGGIAIQHLSVQPRGGPKCHPIPYVMQDFQPGGSASARVKSSALYRE